MIDEGRLLDTFLSLVKIDSPSGEEGAVATELVARLTRLGLKVQRDAVHNISASLTGTGTPVLLAAHMDTVMPGRGIKPVVRDGVVYSDGTTILGADDKAGVAVLLEVLQTIASPDGSNPAVDVIITAQEECGLIGVKALNVSGIRGTMGVSLDAGGAQGTIVVAAPSHDMLDVTIRGRAAHAGAQPEAGVSAIVAAADAVAHMPLGRIDAETTANIGTIHGGMARNIIPDRVELIGEARSHDPAKLAAQTAAMVTALREAAARHGATVDVQSARSYQGYRLTESDQVVQKLMAACRAVGVEPCLETTGGGSDANVLNALGWQLVNLSVGIYDEHTVNEHIAVRDMATCARIVLQFLKMRS